MTQKQWLILGAVLLAIAVIVFIVFFCPGTCD
jgi:hypothetical protein